MLKRLIKIILVLLLFIVLFDCAKQGVPGGGPMDEEPPLVIKTIPQTDSIGIPLNLTEIYIEFSERMNEGSLSKAIFISPPCLLYTSDAADE